MRPSRLIVSTLTASAAIFAISTTDASAGCQRQVTTGNKTLGSGRTDQTSFFTLTRGQALISVNLRRPAGRCGNGITFEMVSDQTNNVINCAGPDSNEGPGPRLRCRVNVDGGRYNVRVRNPTSCTITYQNSCKNN